MHNKHKPTNVIVSNNSIMSTYRFRQKGNWISQTISAKNERQAREEFRNIYNLKTLHNYEVWKQ